MTGAGFAEDDIERFHPRSWVDTYSVWLNWPVKDEPNGVRVKDSGGKVLWEAKREYLVGFEFGFGGLGSGGRLC